MHLQRTVGILLVIYSLYLAIRLITQIDMLWLTTEDFAYPSDPFWYFLGLLSFNVVTITAVLALGVYLIRSSDLALKILLPLSVLSVLSVGFVGLLLVVSVFVVMYYQRYKVREV